LKAQFPEQPRQRDLQRNHQSQDGGRPRVAANEVADLGMGFEDQPRPLRVGLIQNALKKAGINVGTIPLSAGLASRNLGQDSRHRDDAGTQASEQAAETGLRE
jgi:hypothetical protein